MASSEGKYVCLQIEFAHSNWYWTRQGQGQKSVPVSDAGLWWLMVPAGRSLLSSVNFLITCFSSIKFTSSRLCVDRMHWCLPVSPPGMFWASDRQHGRHLLSLLVTWRVAATCRPRLPWASCWCWAASQLCNERFLPQTICPPSVARALWQLGFYSDLV